jgi:8-oxo-dGTP pyrophosphatase MutT (NUDIX family)
VIQEYVLCYVRLPNTESVYVIEKKRPAWQAGKINLPGGHVEPGETPHEAAARELKEETDLDCIDTKLMGTLEGDGYVVYCVLCKLDPKERHYSESMTDEEVSVMKLSEAYRSPKVMPNLPYVLAFITAGLDGWVITELTGPLGEHWAVTKKEPALAHA